jgi:low temperature requirement protein LtrA
LSQPYSFAFLISALLFAGSVLVPSPWRFYLWGLSLLLSLLMPLFILTLGRKKPEVQAEIDRTSSTSPAVVERFGLFIIIVLGEVIVGVVQGVARHHNLSWLVGGTAALGMMIAIWIWWVYFDFVSHRSPIDKKAAISSWWYLHLPMTMSIAAAGAAVLNVIEHSGKHLPIEVSWLLVGALAIALTSIALLMRTIQIPKKHLRIYRRGSLVTLFSGIFIVLLGLFDLSMLTLLTVMNLFMFATVLYGFKVWIKTFGAEEISLS